MLLAFKNYDLAIYAWLPSVVFSAVESIYLGLALAAIGLHNFPKKKMDMGVPMLPLYCLASGTTIVACWGVYKEGEDWWRYLIVILGVLSNIATVVVICVSYRLHILLLRESGSDEEDGKKTKKTKKPKKSKKHRWRHSKKRGDE
ncbi:hypothetical protein ACM66B_005941 [Microbotryomycetes sp. NB124-2]